MTVRDSPRLRPGAPITSRIRLRACDLSPRACDHCSLAVAAIINPAAQLLPPRSCSLTWLNGEKVGLDDPIARHLPAAVARACPAATRITLRQLATHTSGLPRIAPPRPTSPASAVAASAPVRNLPLDSAVLAALTELTELTATDTQPARGGQRHEA